MYFCSNWTNRTATQYAVWPPCQILKITCRAMRRECRKRFTRHRGLAFPTCITARASCMPGSQPSGVLWSWWREKTSPRIPRIPRACTTRNFACFGKRPKACTISPSKKLKVLGVMAGNRQRVLCFIIVTRNSIWVYISNIIPYIDLYIYILYVCIYVKQDFLKVSIRNTGRSNIPCSQN